MGSGISTAAIPASSPLPPGLEVIDAAGAKDPQLLQEVIDCCARSFAGTPTAVPPREFDWLLGTELSDRSDPTGGRFERMQPVMGFLMHYAFVLGSRGLVLVARSEDAWGETEEEKQTDWKKKLAGCAIVYFYPKAWPAEGGWAQMKAFMAASPKWTKAQKEIIDCPRMKAIDKTCKALHKKHASSPHIFVQVLAVDPAAQNKGIGGKLLRAVHAIGDAMQLSCYLECDSGKNEEIYRKVGYSTAGRETMTCGGKGAAAADMFEGSMCAMRREVGGL